MYCTSACRTVIYENHYRDAVACMMALKHIVHQWPKCKKERDFSQCMKTLMFSGERKVVRKEDNAEN